MSRASDLAEKYHKFIDLPWLTGLAAPQRVIFLSYEPAEELKVRLLHPTFESVTKAAGHGWQLVDLEFLFAKWMSEEEYKESYFESPELLSDDQLEPFVSYAADYIVSSAGGVANDSNAVVAVCGAGGMFGLASVHKIVEQAAKEVAGRLVVFFPGSCDDNNFRLLDGHDGDGYLATVINA